MLCELGDASGEAVHELVGCERRLHLEYGELDFSISQVTAYLSTGDDLEEPGGRVDHDQDAARRRHERAVEPLREGAGLALGRTHEDRELEATGLFGGPDGPVHLEALSGAEAATSGHLRHRSPRGPRMPPPVPWCPCRGHRTIHQGPSRPRSARPWPGTAPSTSSVISRNRASGTPPSSSRASRLSTLGGSLQFSGTSALAGVASSGRATTTASAVTRVKRRRCGCDVFTRRGYRHRHLPRHLLA